MIEGINLVLYNRLKVDEESSEASIPVVDLKPIFSFRGLVNLFVQLVESDDVGEQVL